MYCRIANQSENTFVALFVMVSADAHMLIAFHQGGCFRHCQ